MALRLQPRPPMQGLIKTPFRILFTGAILVVAAACNEINVPAPGQPPATEPSGVPTALPSVSPGSTPTAVPSLIPTPVPGPATTPTPTTTPLALAGAPWQGVRYDKQCPYPDGQGIEGFTVERDGSYYAGPPSAPYTEGWIETADLKDLIAAATTIVNDDLEAPAVCIPAASSPGMTSFRLSVVLFPSDEVTVHSLSFDDAQECLRGDREAATRLRQLMDGLASKYLTR